MSNTMITTLGGLYMASLAAGATMAAIRMHNKRADGYAPGTDTVSLSIDNTAPAAGSPGALLVQDMPVAYAQPAYATPALVRYNLSVPSTNTGASNTGRGFSAVA